MESLNIHGIDVPLVPKEVSSVIWQALISGDYEAKEARLIIKAVKPGDRVLELGSGIGIITSIIAKIEGTSVWAFEANPSTAALGQRVIEANHLDNVVFSQGLLTAGEPLSFRFYVREDLWMSSMDEKQGAYEKVIEVTSANIDAFISQHRINALVMDIEGAERELLQHAELPGIERIFLELHDHLYGLSGIRDISHALGQRGYAYDPRCSRGPCILFNKDKSPRQYDPDIS